MRASRPAQIAPVKQKTSHVFESAARGHLRAQPRRGSRCARHTFPADALQETLTAKQILALADFVIDGKAHDLDKRGYFYWCPLFIFAHAPATIRSLANRGLVTLDRNGDRASLTKLGHQVIHFLRRRVR